MALSVIAVVVAGVGLWVATGVQDRSGKGKPESGQSPADRPPPPSGDAAPTIDLRALRDVAVIRYDALQEMSGQLSFSLALLNAVGDGVVLSSINGRAETRTYAKSVRACKGVQELSPEEAQAVHSAQLGTGLSTIVATA